MFYFRHHSFSPIYIQDINILNNLIKSVVMTHTEAGGVPAKQGGVPQRKM